MPKGQVLVELDHTEEWDSGTDWEALANAAVTAAFAVVDFSSDAQISLSINLSDNDEVQALNAQWRGKNKPTNVLSFPMLEDAELALFQNSRHPELVSGSISPRNPKVETEKWTLKQVQGDGIESEVLLGDLILAHGVCTAEATEKQIPLSDYVTHLIVHGALHLLGLDHIDDAEAEHMEALEVKALASLGLPNPY
jgi:probable rRNA maturation factor